MRVTQEQIAKKCGIDVSSANKILNEVPGPVFREETIEKVWAVARELGYTMKKPTKIAMEKMIRRLVVHHGGNANCKTCKEALELVGRK